MKYLTLIVSVFSLYSTLWAQDSAVYVSQRDGRICYRVFNEPGGGFSIIGAEAVGSPLLARVDQGQFCPDSLPPTLLWWLEQYADQIATVREPQSSALRVANEHRTVTPLIQTQWGQEYPYNSAIPYSTDRYLTGCVATAMGQVMRYYQHPTKGQGRSSRVVDGLNFQANFSSTRYDYSKMLDTYLAGAYNDEQALAMSTLLYHAGMSVGMDYGTDGSGAMTTAIPQKMVSTFGYSKKITYHSRTYYTDAEWEDLLCTELEQGHPIIYRGTNRNDESRQHCFVCDGYDAQTGLFHFNWGWSGSGDGYFAMTGAAALDGGSFNYGNSQSAILGIMPNDGTTTVAPLLFASKMQLKASASSGSKSEAYSYYVVGDADMPTMRLYSTFKNCAMSSVGVDYAIQFTHQEDQQTYYQEIGSASSMSFSVNKSINGIIDIAPLRQHPGVYTVQMVFRPKGSSNDWAPARLSTDVVLPQLQIGGSGQNRLEGEEQLDVVNTQKVLVSTQSYTVDREANQGNVYSIVHYDDSAIRQALGVQNITTDMIYQVRSTSGNLLQNWQEYGGWLNLQGDPVSYSQEEAVMMSDYPQGGQLRLHTNPVNELAAGQECHVQWAFVFEDKKVLLDAVIRMTPSVQTTERTDYTSYIVNPDFAGNDMSGWSGTEWSQYEGDENAEHYAGIPDTYQEITGLPKGIYLLEVDGLDRMGFWEQAVEWYNKREVHGNRAVIYANSSTGVYQCAMRQLMDGAGVAPLNVGREIQVQDRDGKVCYIPDNMVAAGAYFRDGRYRNGLYVEVGDDGVLTIGVTNGISYPYYLEGNWICVDNWHLTYLGEDYKEHYPGETIYTVRGTEIANPTYDGGDVYSGWNGFLFPYWGSSVAAYEKLYNDLLDNYQYLSGLTPGKYLLEVDGLFTFWCWEEDGRIYWHDIRNESNLCHLYAQSSFGEFQVPITRTCYGVKDDPSYSDEYCESEWHSGWLPNHVTQHIPHVSEDCYHNGMYVEVGEDGELKIGLRESVIEGIPFPNRMAFDNWKLTYLGKSHPAPSGADLYGFRKQFDTHKEYLAFQEQLDGFLASSSDNEKFDMTSLLRYQGFDTDDEYMYYWWKGEPVRGWGCSEKWNCSFDVYQETAPLPEGYYELRCQGFYRYCDRDENTNAIAVSSNANGTEKLLAYLYANDAAVTLQSIVIDNKQLQGVVDDGLLESGLPFSMQASRQAFDAGLYDDNVVYFHLNGYEPLRFGVRESQPEGVTSDWAIFDNFRLYYYGKNKPADYDSSIEEVRTSSASATSDIYDVYGCRQSTLRRGFNIVGNSSKLVYIIK